MPPRYRRSLIIAVILTMAAAVGHAAAIRTAVWDGRFYPDTADSLTAAITALMAQAAEGDQGRQPRQDAVPRALVLPHAGYVYSGWTAAHGLWALPARGIDKVVLLGPDHRVGLPSAAVSDVDAYETPMGLIQVHPDAHRLLTQAALFQYSPASDRMEHSIEVILPYLQYRLGPFRLVPIVVGQAAPARLARSINSLLDERTLLVVSSDLSHYLPYDQAIARDKETLDMIVGGRVGELMHGDNRACGRLPLAVLMIIARERGWRPVVLHTSNSGDTAGPKDRVVGYAAIAYYGEAAMTEQQAALSDDLTPEQGEALVALARLTIAKKLGIPADPQSAGQIAATIDDAVFQTNKGTFVTLKKRGQLRGCIGSLSARQPLKDDVIGNAINAAFRDPRFPPLSAAEFDQVDIEVSVLSDPQPLAYASADDLVRRLRPGVDGVILQRGIRRATFLPQVWEQLPTHEAFLGHLCLKAGLPETAWRDGDLEVFTYQVTYFEEPHGAR